MFKKNGTLVAVLVLGFLIQALPAPGSPREGVRLPWSTFEDAVLDYSVQYPTGWRVSPPPALSGLVSPVLTFKGPVPELVKAIPADPHARRGDRISVGQFLHSIEEDETLLSWVERYNEAYTEGVLLEISPLDLGDREAVYGRGYSTLTNFHFVNLRVGKTVWFLWGNFDAAADHPGAGTLLRMARSLSFGPRAPQTLQERYGQHFPAPKLEAPPRQEVLVDSLSSIAAPLSSSWYSPVLKSYGNQWPITCGSAAHTDGAYYAADVDATENWQVLAAQAASVYASGWDNGYGNRVKLGPTSGYYHYYAHLVGIFWPVSAGSSVSRGDLVGWVGDTGTDDVHLHFHVQDGASQGSSNGINLIGMTGFTDNTADSYYPSNDGVSHYSCAWMGR